jgi:hypothetical protein
VHNISYFVLCPIIIAYRHAEEVHAVKLFSFSRLQVQPINASHAARLNGPAVQSRTKRGGYSFRLAGSKFIGSPAKETYNIRRR